MRDLVRCAPLASVWLASCIASEPPIEVRWFAPPAAPVERTGTGEAPVLRLDDVAASPQLDQRMVWRLSDVRFAFDETNRWMLTPAESTRRALIGALFASGRFTPAPNAEAPTLDARVVTFDAVLGETPHVELRVVAVYREGFSGPTRYRAFGEQEKLTDTTPDAFAEAAGKALVRIADAVAGWLAAG